jgi:hypothetical protein
MEVRVEKNGNEKKVVKGQQPKRIDCGRMLVNVR